MPTQTGQRTFRVTEHVNIEILFVLDTDWDLPVMFWWERSLAPLFACLMRSSDVGEGRWREKGDVGAVGMG